MPCEPSIFAGMTPAAKLTLLQQAQAAYTALSLGSKAETLSYTQGDGGKSASFTRASLGNLTLMIKQLQSELGMIGRVRRPIGFRFR